MAAFGGWDTTTTTYSISPSVYGEWERVVERDRSRSQMQQNARELEEMAYRYQRLIEIYRSGHISENDFINEIDNMSSYYGPITGIRVSIDRDYRRRIRTLTLTLGELHKRLMVDVQLLVSTDENGYPEEYECDVEDVDHEFKEKLHKLFRSRHRKIKGLYKI